MKFICSWIHVLCAWFWITKYTSGDMIFIKTSIITFKQVISTTSIRLEVVIFPIQAELEITTVSKNDDRVVNHYNWSWSIWHLHNNTLKIGLLSLFNVLCVNLIPPPPKKNIPKLYNKNKCAENEKKELKVS